MTREVKYRMWCKGISKMVDPLNITPLALNEHMAEKKGLYLPFDDDIVLMQFTGLKDKNGVDIYEGDIIRDAPFRGFKPYTVSYRNGMFSCAYIATSTDGNLHNTEIIGNMFENVELLENCDNFWEE